MDTKKQDPRYLRTVYYLRSTTYSYAYSQEASEELARNENNEKFPEEVWEDIYKELVAEWKHNNPRTLP
jgi:hypothetical protein